MEDDWFLLLFVPCQLKNLEALPNNKPALTAYSRVSGQEWFFLNIDKDFIWKLLQVREGGTLRISHSGWLPVESSAPCSCRRSGLPREKRAQCGN